MAEMPRLARLNGFLTGIYLIEAAQNRVFPREKTTDIVDNAVRKVKRLAKSSTCKCGQVLTSCG